MPEQLIPKKVTLNLVGIDGNIFSVVGAFNKQARREKWTPDEIKVVNDAVYASQNYDEALTIIIRHCQGDDRIKDDPDDLSGIEQYEVEDDEED